MEKLEINAFRMSFTKDNLLNQIKTSWMGTDYTPPVEVLENIEINIDDVKVQTANSFKIANSPSEINFQNDKCDLRREIKEHEIFPFPEIILTLKNTDNKKHDYELNWILKSLNNYVLIQEKLAEAYTLFRQDYLFFFRVPSFYHQEKNGTSCHSVKKELNAGERIELHITLFFARSFYDCLGFSGIGFLINKNDFDGAIGAIGTDIFGYLETSNHSFPIQNLYSPIFWTENGSFPNSEVTLKTIDNSRIKKFLYFEDSDVDAVLKKKLQQRNMDLIKIEKLYNNKALDIQYTIDNLLKRKVFFHEIVVLPRDILLILNSAAYTGRLGIKILIYNASTFDLIKRIRPQITSVISQKTEIPLKFDDDIRKASIYINRAENPLTERNYIAQFYFLTRFLINKLILREYIDPDDSEWELFLSKVGYNEEEINEKYSKPILQEIFNWEQLNYADAAVNGPQMAILATGTEKEWQNAAIGANFSKGFNAGYNLISDYSIDDKEKLKNILKSIDENLMDYEKLISLSLEITQIVANNIPKIALAFSEYITLFPADASVPFELVFFEGRFGLESIGTKYCMGRIVGEDIYDTSLVATSAIVFSLITHKKPKFLIVGNPTADPNLGLAVEETAAVAGTLDVYKYPYTFLSGTRILDSIIEGINQNFKKIGIKLDINKFRKLPKPSKKRFLEELEETNFLHFSGHGGIDENGPFLVLSDQHFTLNDIPSSLNGNPFIFANACLAGLSVNYEKNVSLASKFMKNGSIGYIGALWQVTDMVASLLGSIFYKFLFTYPIGAVLRSLKDALMLAVPDDYTPLAFILAGFPTLHFIDPYYKAMEFLYFHKNTIDSLNIGKTNKGLEYFQRTIYAISIFKKELEDRIRLKPENMITNNSLILNLESAKCYLTQYYDTVKTGQEALLAIFAGNWEKIRKFGEESLISGKKILEASDIAYDSGLRFSLRMHYYHTKQLAYLYLINYAYFSNDLESASENIKRGYLVWKKANEQCDKLIERIKDTVVPIEQINNQQNAMGNLLTAWGAIIEGLKESNKENTVENIFKKFSTAIEFFNKNYQLNDRTMILLTQLFMNFILYDYGVLFSNLHAYDKSNIAFNQLGEKCKEISTQLKTLIQLQKAEFLEEIGGLQTQLKFVQGMEYIAQAFLSFNSYRKTNRRKDKDSARKWFKNAIDSTPNRYYQVKWEEFHRLNLT